MKSTVPLIPASADETGQPATTTGDARFHQLLARYGSLLRGTIVRVCPQALRASLDDIEQEARIRLWKVLHHEREIAHPVSYIYKVAVSTTLRAIRTAKAKREEPIGEQEPGYDQATAAALATPPHASPEAVAERREWLRKIDAAMRQLAENRRIAVGLHLQGLTTQQIADLLEWTEPKARNLVHRGLRDLRDALRTEGIELNP
jgi:RNA polymerase sigma factor (sigma-70 family)